MKQQPEGLSQLAASSRPLQAHHMKLLFAVACLTSALDAVKGTGWQEQGPADGAGCPAACPAAPAGY